MTALHHRLDGPPDAPVLVLSNSLGTTLEMWDVLVPNLAERFRILRYDQRGHGRSPVPPGPYAIADLGRDVLALLDALEIERPAFCGVSLGAMTGMWVAAEAPERVARLALCCTSAWLGPAETWDERARTVRERGMGAIADTVLERWFTPAFRSQRPDVVGRFADALRETPAEGYAGCCGAIERMDLREDLRRIAAPTLVISGSDDPSTPVEHQRRIAEAIPGARLSVMPGVGHGMFWEATDAFNELVLEFLRRVSSQQSAIKEEPAADS